MHVFWGVQREISTGALPWAFRRFTTDVMMIADGILVGKISPMSTRDECEDSEKFDLGGVRSLLINFRDTNIHQSNSMWVLASRRRKRLNTQKSTLMGSTHRHCSRESCAWGKREYDQFTAYKHMTRRPIKRNSWGPFYCRSATHLNVSITLAASVFHPQDCELLRGHRTRFGCRPCEWIISKRTSKKASLFAQFTLQHLWYVYTELSGKHL